MQQFESDSTYRYINFISQGMVAILKIFRHQFGAACNRKPSYWLVSIFALNITAIRQINGNLNGDT